MNRLHAESMDLFAKLSDEDLKKKCLTPAGTPITTWKWLRAMCEHEIHHRGQIFIYLGMLDVKNPALYGLTAEEVQERSKPFKILTLNCHSESSRTAKGYFNNSSTAAKTLS